VIRRVAVAALIALLGCVLALPASAGADSTITVNTTNTGSPMGDSLCSLVEAVAYANGTSEPDCAPGVASGTTTIDVQASANKYAISSVL